MNFSKMLSVYQQKYLNISSFPKSVPSKEMSFLADDMSFPTGFEILRFSHGC